MNTLSEQDFRLKSDQALESASAVLQPLSDQKGFEIELQNGVLNILFEEPEVSRFVISPNAPVRQIWVSAMARSYKLAWSPEAGDFVHSDETLSRLLQRLVRTFLDRGSAEG